MDRCLVCKQLKFGPYHTCPPAWYALIVEVDMEINEEINGDSVLPDKCRIYADSASDAAEKRVAKWDDGELAHKGDEIEVVVYDSLIENPLHFMVQGDVQPVYSACEKVVRQNRQGQSHE